MRLLRAARDQSEWPAAQYERLHGRLLFEASHRLSIEPSDQAVRLLTPEQVDELEQFLLQAEGSAADGADQVVRVEEERGFNFKIHYLGSELTLKNEPPPLVARLNPTAITFGVGGFFKFIDLVFPFGGGMPGIVNLPLMAIDIASSLRYWQRPPGTGDTNEIVALAAIPTALAIALSGHQGISLNRPRGRRRLSCVLLLERHALGAVTELEVIEYTTPTDHDLWSSSCNWRKRGSKKT